MALGSARAFTLPLISPRSALNVPLLVTLCAAAVGLAFVRPAIGVGLVAGTLVALLVLIRP